MASRTRTNDEGAQGGVAVGDVYAVDGQRRDVTWVFVVTTATHNEVVLAPLHWFGADAPPSGLLDGLPLLEHSSFHIDETWQYLTSPDRLETRLRKVGHRKEPVQLTPQHCRYDVLDTVIRRCEREMLWVALPQALRQQYKEVLPTGWSSAGDDARASLDELRERVVDQLMWVGEDEHVLEYILANPLLLSLRLTRCTRQEIDLEATHVLELWLGGNQRRVVVPSFIEEITLQEPSDESLRIQHSRGGAGMRLVIESLRGRDVPDLCVPKLMALRVHGAELDLESIALRYPQLEVLELFGSPGILHHLPALKNLPRLRSLHIKDFFGFDADVFPSPDELPLLESLILVSIPADVGKKARKAYRHLPVLDVVQLRSSEWLAVNLHNPFRDWDGRAHIKPAVAKAAFRAYVKVKKKLDQLQGNVAEAEAIFTEFILELNKLASKSALETMERDEVVLALYGLAEPLGISKDQALDWWEKAEDF